MQQKAFTLIELLVVVLIIGILAAVALPQYQKAVTKSRFATVKNVTRHLWEQEKLYYLANGEYADSFTKMGMETPIYPWGSCHIASFYVFCKHDNINAAFLIKFNGDQYCVTYNSDSNSVKLCKQETGKNTAAPNTNDSWFKYP